LVDAGGHVRLLAFGIGQFTDSLDERTQTLWRAMTPGYAAPEQLRGAPPSTAIDVYGLGALLHRLLTGRTPQTATGGSESTQPSLLVRSADDAYHRHYVPLKNDLDRVLLKALAEDPEQRYPSAEALADDLRRWLDGQPVLAQKPRLAYRFRKFVGRNKLGVVAAVLLVASLAGGIGSTLWQADVARREADNARAQAQRAVLVRDFLQRVFASTEPATGGVPDALELLDEGARRARADVLATDPLAAADILMLTGQARLALGQYEEAQADLEQARSLLGSGTSQIRERLRIEQELSQLTRERGEVDTAQRHADAAIALGERVLAEDGDPEPLLSARVSRAMSLFSGNPQAAKVLFEEVLEALPRHGLLDTELHITVLQGLDTTLSVTDPDDTQRLIALAEEQLRLSRLLDGPDSGRYADTLAQQVPNFSRAGDHDRAEQLAFEAAALTDRIYTKPHSTRAGAYCQLGAYLHLRGRYAEAVERYAVANDINTQLKLSNLHVEACFRLSAYAYSALGDHRIALVNLEQSWRILGDHDYRVSPTGHASCGVRATAQLRLGDIAAAQHSLAECPPDPAVTPQMMHTQARAELHVARGELQEAAGLATEMRKTRRPEAGDRYWMRPWMLSLLLAHDMGDTAMKAALLDELGEFAKTAPLSHCLARPDKANCLVLP
ncbi:MAG TPA: hypothetical protein VLZ76_02200, partial [Lysobacter sp.]|nr:hypothetical protein [Lysobacter sp.]